MITSFNKMNKVVSIKSIKCLLDNLITSFKSVPGMKLSDGNFTSNADSITLIKNIHWLTMSKWSNETMGICNFYTKIICLV